MIAGVVPASAILSAPPAGAVASPPENFSAHLDGGQETPAHVTTAIGTGTVTLSGDESVIIASVSWSGLSANAAAAHIHGPASPGTAAPVLFPFTGVPGATAGATPLEAFSITPAQVALLKAGLLYFNVHSATFPAGEIRGQIHLAAPPALHFTGALLGSQETPPHASPATGSGSVALSPDETTITVNLSWSGLVAKAVAAHIHGPANPGTAAPVLFPFTGVPSATSGAIAAQAFAITPSQVIQLKAGLFYFNVHSSTFPGGEIRGQIHLASDSQGFRTVAGDNTVFGFGVAPLGATTASPSRLHGQPLNRPIVGMSNTPDWLGYWTAASDGGVFTFGDAGFFGSLGSLRLNAPVVGIAHTPDGKGYWLAASDGGIFTFGDAGFFGSLGSIRLNSPIVGVESTPDGGGYWLAGADGGVFTFGDARFFGAFSGHHPAMVGIARTPDGGGYWLADTVGGIFTSGDATFHGTVPMAPGDKAISGLAAAGTG